MADVDTALAAEIRSNLRDQDITADAEAATSDPRVSSALLSAPAILTGLKPDQLALVRKSATKARYSRPATRKGPAYLSRPDLLRSCWVPHKDART